MDNQVNLDLVLLISEEEISLFILLWGLPYQPGWHWQQVRIQMNLFWGSYVLDFKVEYISWDITVLSYELLVSSFK